jgi:hypothetical protein
VRFKQLTLQEAAALRVKVDAQVALLGKVATGDLSSADAESQLQVGCVTICHASEVGLHPAALLVASQRSSCVSSDMQVVRCNRRTTQQLERGCQTPRWCCCRSQHLVTTQACR